MQIDIKTIAFYLPQFHPIPENDLWWGKGFTEWTNVTKAQPLYPGHVQPFLPSDLGFYDLRVPEVREAQVQLAKEAGITAFAYWHYWFGNGKRILERPLREVLSSNKPDYPFCIAWANETWSGRWHGLDSKILVEQTYGGKQDQINFFYDSLPYFKDERYLRFNDKHVFIVYFPYKIPDAKRYIENWREIGLKEGIEFHLIGVGDGSCMDLGYDGFVSHGPIIPYRLLYKNKFEELFYKKFKKRWQKALYPKRPDRISYEDFTLHYLNEPLKTGECPLVITNWDNTPRSGSRGLVLEKSNPVLFGTHLQKAFDRVLDTRKEGLIFIKSWNEWAEGNVLEPSRIWGDEYIKTCSRVVNANNR